MSEQPIAETIQSDASGIRQPHESDRSVLLAATGGSIVFVGSVFGYGSQLVTGIFLTRLLGAEQYGQYKVAVIAGEMAAGFALLGLDYAMVRFVALFASRHDDARQWGTLQLGIGLTTVSSLLIGAGLFFLAPYLAVNVFREPQLILLLRLSSLVVPFSALTGILASATRGHNKMQYNVGARQVAQPLVRLALLALLALIGLTAAKALIAYIAGLVVACALLVYFMNHLFSMRRSLQAGRRETRQVMLFSLPAYFSTLISTFGPSLQTVLLGSLNTMATVGIFAVATQVSTASTLFNQSIGTAADPIISGLHGQGDQDRMTHFYKTTTKWMFTVNLPMFLIVLLLSAPILGIFGHDFVSGSTALIVLSFSNLIIAAAGVSDGLLAMTGNTSVKLANSAVQAVLSVGLCYVLIPRFGALGAAAAVLIASTVLHIIMVLEVFFLFRMLPYTMGFFKPAAAGLLALGVGLITRQLLHDYPSLALAALTALATLTAYLGMVLLFGLSQEDRAVLGQLRRRTAGAFLGKK